MDAESHSLDQTFVGNGATIPPRYAITCRTISNSSYTGNVSFNLSLKNTHRVAILKNCRTKENVTFLQEC